MLNYFKHLISIIFLLLYANQVSAQNPNTLLNKWNGVVSNDITNIGEIEGRLFIGHNYNISNSHQFGFKLTSNPVSDIVFAVGGAVTTNGQANIKVFYGSAAIAGTVAQTNWFQMMNGGTLQMNSTWPALNSPVQVLTDASNYWKTLTPNGTIQTPGSQPAPLKFICPANQETAVFTISDVQSLENSKVQQIEVTPTSATKTIIINIASVDGTVNWNYGNMVGNFDNIYWRSRIIWNIYTTANNGQLGSVNCMPNMKGALIAPGATVTGNSNFDGPVFCKNLAITSEIHFTGWNGEAPVPVVPPTCTQSWSGSLGADSSVCEFDAKTFKAVGTITKQPTNAPAYLQLYWKVIAPSHQDTSTTYINKWIYSDTSVVVSGNWPGVLATDTLVHLRVGMRLFNCDMEKIGNDVVKNYIWRSTVCPPPAPQEADIKVIKTVSNNNVQNGSQLTFTITATNLGPKAATNISILDQLAAGLTYSSHSTSTGTFTPATGVWVIPALANGASATLNITVNTAITASQNGSLSLGDASAYNLFVFDNFSAPSSDVEGRMAVGKNAFMSNYSVGYNLPVDNFGTSDVLVVGGNLTFLSGSVYNGNIVYNGSTNLPVNQVSIVGGSLIQDSVINFESTSAYLQTLSHQLAQMPENGTITYEYGGIFMSGTNPAANVFHVDGSKLTTANDIQITVPNGAVALVSVSGDSLEWQGGFKIFGTPRTNVLFTFENAKKLNIHNIDITAAVLAPLADVTFPSGVVNGQFICKSMTGSGQFNYCPFLGNIPVDSNLVNTAVVISSSPLDPTASNNSSTVGFKVSFDVSNSSGSGSNVEWTVLPGASSSVMMTDFVTDLNNTMYIAQQGGSLLKSTDSGASWVKVQSNLQVSYIWNLAVGNDNKLYAATEQGLFVSTNQGTEWSVTGLTGHDTRDVVITSNGKIYAGTWDAGILCSSNNGSSWTTINDGLFSTAIHALAVIADTIYCGTFGSGVYSLLPTSSTWQHKIVGYDYIWTLAVSSNNTLIAGTYGAGMFRSTDYGNTWEASYDGLNSRYIYHIHVGDDGIVYASGWSAGVFASTDNGQSWISGGLEGLGINLVYSNSTSTKGIESRIYAASANGTIYYTDVPFTSVESEAIVYNYDLQQNYPNPFNPSTTISYQIPTDGIVTLKIYDILGREITTLLNEYKTKGKYNIQFNAKNLASGMYIYQLKSGNYTNAKKLMLIK